MRRITRRPARFELPVTCNVAAGLAPGLAPSVAAASPTGAAVAPASVDIGKTAGAGPVALQRDGAAGTPGAEPAAAAPREPVVARAKARSGGAFGSAAAMQQRASELQKVLGVDVHP